MQKYLTSSTRLLLSRQVIVAQPVMHFATPKSTGPLSGKEKGDEKQFFNKEDEKLLKGLLKKVQQ